MPASNCAVPGCTWNYNNKTNGDRISLFSVLRPEFGKSPEEVQHRQTLTNFILSMRDGSLDNIKHLLHKEAVGICARHFKEEDIEWKGSRNKLKPGAVPCKNLPKECSFSRLAVKSSRTEKALTRKFTPLIRHKNLDQLLNAYNKLTLEMKDKWILYIHSSYLYIESMKEHEVVLRVRFV
ncbi:uncharacterized protein LOC144745247 [Ciona intestinalis]